MTNLHVAVVCQGTAFNAIRTADFVKRPRVSYNSETEEPKD